jgi:hypothetical protein
MTEVAEAGGPGAVTVNSSKDENNVASEIFNGIGCKQSSGSESL